MERRSIDQEFTNELLEFLYRAQSNGYGSDKEPSISKDARRAESSNMPISGMAENPSAV